LQLFNLADDPGETTTLAAKYPDRVRDIVAAYRKILDTGRRTPGPALPNSNELHTFQPVPRFVWGK
jgi:hypothetical protein